MATSSSASKPTIGILSIGEMGLGIAKVLRAHDYVVSTNIAGRSKYTTERIENAQIIAYDTDEDLVAEADIILSIVPPRDAVSTSRRILDASRHQATIKRRAERRGTAAVQQAPSLTYIDLNAISPRTCQGIAELLNTKLEPSNSLPRRISRTLSLGRPTADSELDPINIKFLDGGIIGPPPTQDAESQTWKLPSLVISGPKTDDLDPTLISTLNINIIGDRIGAASTLKACFASLTKGLAGLSILSFTTAHTCGVLDELQSHLERFSPHILTLARNGLTGMPPKAYRWVDEMRQIGETFADDGGLGMGKNIYDGIADIYKTVAEDTVLGQERSEKRKRGTNIEDVVECVREGVTKKRVKSAQEGKLDLAWRGSWS